MTRAADQEGKPGTKKPKTKKKKRKSAPATNHRPTSIDERETSEVMAAFRQAARGRGWQTRDELLREVARSLGYQRLGANIRKTLQNHMRAAIIRGIIETDGDEVRAFTHSMDDYQLPSIRDTLTSVMRKRSTYDRETVIHAVAAYLGFQRVTQNVRKPIKSAITSAIRQGILGYDGDEIWREES